MWILSRGMSCFGSASDGDGTTARSFQSNDPCIHFVHLSVLQMDAILTNEILLIYTVNCRKVNTLKWRAAGVVTIRTPFRLKNKIIRFQFSSIKLEKLFFFSWVSDLRKNTSGRNDGNPSTFNHSASLGITKNSKISLNTWNLPKSKYLDCIPQLLTIH